MDIKNVSINNQDPYRTRLNATENNAAQGRAAKSEPGGNPVSQGDRVSLSASARLHTLAHAEAGKAPDIRQEKVDDIKARVASGEYSVDSKKVAEKLLRSEGLLASSLERE